MLNAKNAACPHPPPLPRMQKTGGWEHKANEKQSGPEIYVQKVSELRGTVCQGPRPWWA